MIDVVRSIKKRLTKYEPITERQFNAVVKFIEREKKFKGMDRLEIYIFFEPLFYPYNEKETLNDLTDFFVD
jgi:hypothetical protein